VFTRGSQSGGELGSHPPKRPRRGGTSGQHQELVSAVNGTPDIL